MLEGTVVVHETSVLVSRLVFQRLRLGLNLLVVFDYEISVSKWRRRFL